MQVTLTLSQETINELRIAARARYGTLTDRYEVERYSKDRGYLARRMAALDAFLARVADLDASQAVTK